MKTLPALSLRLSSLWKATLTVPLLAALVVLSPSTQSTAAAQSLGDNSSAAGPAAGAGGADPAVEEVVFTAADPQGLSPEQLRALGSSYLQLMRTTQAEVRALYGTAKDNNDVVKTLCLDDKLQQIEAALSTASDRNTTLVEALDGGAVERGRHEFTLIGVLAERVSLMALEANQCIGEETSFSEDNESTLELAVEGVLPEVNAEVIILPPVLVIPPSVKSPVD
jgi:hypothetical protein